MPTLDLPRCRLAYRVTGSGPAVVQLHGLMSDQVANAAGGLDLAAGLPAHRIVRYDARGHGASAAELAQWPRLCADFVHQVESGPAGGSELPGCRTGGGDAQGARHGARRQQPAGPEPVTR
ncbi:alpha/beta fold hydrolase [Kocuria sp. M1R5S2]|uniref:alpha/beta fold hydrolase n=1 Tax=Kocuria rhizosphaerae TaxID=3376285 RepID=UPI0037BDA0CF